VLEYCLVLNAWKNRSFIDLDNYPLLPNFPQIDAQNAIPTPRQITKAMSSVNPFHQFDRQFRNLPPVNTTPHLPADWYFHVGSFNRRRSSLDDPSAQLCDWVDSTFDVRIQREPRLDVLYVGNQGIRTSCLDATRSRRGFSVRFDQDSIASEAGWTLNLPGLADSYLRCLGWKLSVVSPRQSDPVVVVDPAFEFVTSMAIGEFGIFCVVDLTPGLSLAYRIVYNEKAAASLNFLARCESGGSCRSAVSDVSAIAATFSDANLLIWHLSSGAIHRRLKFESAVTAVAFDSNFHGLMVATDQCCIYLSINGERLLSIKFPHVSQLVFVFLNMADPNRCALCGTKSGKLVALHPNFVNDKIEVNELETRHSAAVTQLILHRSRKYLISIDESGRVCRTKLA
jgi:hypothetical protein